MTLITRWGALPAMARGRLRLSVARGDQAEGSPLIFSEILRAVFEGRRHHRLRRRGPSGQTLRGAHPRADPAVVTRRRKESHRMIIRCRVCGADPCGRWKSPPAMIFCDPYQEDGSARDDRVYACRDHLSAKREKEIQEWEKDRGWKKGELR
jgi:hypothetical protein